MIEACFPFEALVSVGRGTGKLIEDVNHCNLF